MSGNLELVLWIYRRSWTYTPFRIGKADSIWIVIKEEVKSESNLFHGYSGYGGWERMGMRI